MFIKSLINEKYNNCRDRVATQEFKLASSLVYTERLSACKDCSKIGRCSLSGREIPQQQLVTPEKLVNFDFF